MFIDLFNWYQLDSVKHERSIFHSVHLGDSKNKSSSILTSKTREMSRVQVEK